MKKIAIDITGGDYSPNAPLCGAIKFANENKNIKLKIIGFQKNFENNLPDNIEKIIVTEKIKINDEAAIAVRNKKDSAIVVGSKLVRDKEIDAFISAGSTAAIISAGVLIVKRIKGIERPAFPIVLPNIERNTMRVYLDVGATTDSKPQNLVSNARLGSIYSKEVLKIKNPNVKLINVGLEQNKGNELYRETFKLLKEEKEINFTGNVEGYDVMSTDADVVVMDGFTGNILLKTIEGNLNMFKKQLKTMFKSSLSGKISALLVKSKILKFKEELNPHKIACAPVLGINGLMVKVHGSATEENFYNALKETTKLLEIDFVSKLEKDES